MSDGSGKPSLQQTFNGAVHAFWSPDPPNVVAENLELHPRFSGSVAEDGFSLRINRGRKGKNSWRPTVKGSIRAAAGGTLVEAKLAMHPFVLVFTLVHGMLLLGIAWIMAFFAYRSGVEEARTLLTEAVNAQHLDDAARAKAGEHEVADPESPGAALDPPLSFATRSSMHEARLVVKSSLGERTTLVVRQAALTIARGDKSLTLDWNDIRGVELQDFHPDDPDRGDELVLETPSGPRYVPVGGHPPADQQWLARFLSSRNARWSEAEADRLRGDADRQRLAAMQSTERPQ